MKRQIASFIFLSAFLSLTQCSVSTYPGDSSWESAYFQQHPLVGKIWSYRDSAFVEPIELEAAISRSHYLLLGEKHDNPDHHRLRRQLINNLLLAQKFSVLGMEMLNSDQQQLLDAAVENNLHSGAQLRAALNWDEQGWDWDFYGPVLEDLLRAGVQVRAANISLAEMMAVYQGEIDEQIIAALDEEKLRQLTQGIDESHCGMLPESQFASMVRVQQARDFKMAQSLLTDSSGLRVLLAGNYHIRKDLGVANYLPQTDNASESRVLALAFLEVNEELSDPQQYAEMLYAADAFDYVWFTPAFSLEDYCASMRADE